jgi:hypothetical protein
MYVFGVKELIYCTSAVFDKVFEPILVKQTGASCSKRYEPLRQIACAAPLNVPRDQTQQPGVSPVAVGTSGCVLLPPRAAYRSVLL